MDIRRVVTGENDGGTAVFANVEELPPMNTQYGQWRGVWGWDELPTLPVNPTDGYNPRSRFAPIGGLRVNVITFNPGGDQELPDEEAEAYKKLERAQTHGRLTEDAGMHRTDSIEIAFVLEGEVGLEQDEEEVTLRFGDVLVQNGARHAWRPRGDKPATLGFVVISTPRADGS